MSGLMQLIPLGRGCVNGCRGVMEVQTGGSGSRHTVTRSTHFLSTCLLMLHVFRFRIINLQEKKQTLFLPFLFG